MVLSEDKARLAVGIIGNVLSAIMFIAPAPSTIRRIWKKKTTEEFHPYPQLATTMNCLLWIFYGLPIVHPDSTLVITINGFGLALQIIYLSIFFIFTTPRYRLIIVGILIGELCFLGGVALITLLCFHNLAKRQLVVGVITVIFGIIMYGSPLSNLRDVLKTKSVEFMQIWLIITGFCNGLLWATYAFLKTFDPFILTANGTGALLGIGQIGVYVYFAFLRKKTPSDEKPGPGDVQLPTTNKDLPV